MVGLHELLAKSTAVAQTPPTAAAATRHAPLRPQPPHFPARAKRVIHIFLNGGPSHVDTFDPKPLLKKYEGRSLPVPNLQTESPTGSAFPSPFKFRRYGQSGISVSELFADVGECIDDVCVIRSMYADVPNHEPSLMLVNRGENTSVRPSMGSWLTYGLGSESENLPGFIAMCPGGLPVKGVDNWRSAFLPGVFQGTYVDTSRRDIHELIANIENSRLSPATLRRQLDLVQAMNRLHQRTRWLDPRPEARIQSFEQAYRMQRSALEAFAIRRESRSTREMYGRGTQSRQILIAR